MRLLGNDEVTARWGQEACFSRVREAKAAAAER
jgi:hypothetical protein